MKIIGRLTLPTRVRVHWYVNASIILNMSVQCDKKKLSGANNCVNHMQQRNEVLQDRRPVDAEIVSFVTYFN